MTISNKMAPLHIMAGLPVTGLTKTFVIGGIGRCGPMDSSTRSPDLTPPDFFLWGALKHDVYSKNPCTIPELKDIIRQKCLRIDIELCEKACQSVIARMPQCIQVEGEVFEHYE